MTARIRLLFAAARRGGRRLRRRRVRGARRRRRPRRPAHRPGLRPQIVGLDMATLLGRGDPERQLMETRLRAGRARVLQAGRRPAAWSPARQKALTAYPQSEESRRRPAGAQEHARPATARATSRSCERTLSAVQTRVRRRSRRTQHLHAGRADRDARRSRRSVHHVSHRRKRSARSTNNCSGGNFGGIGVYIVKDPKTGAILVDPIEGNPAVKAGVRTGDVIVAVDGKSTCRTAARRGRARDSRTARNRRLAARSSATTGNAHRDGPRHARRRSTFRRCARRSRTGSSYVRLSDFGTTSADEVRAAFLDGKKKNVHGYILDLRNNGGGLLDAAVDISSLVHRARNDRLDDRPRRPPRRALARPAERSTPYRSCCW